MWKNDLFQTPPKADTGFAPNSKRWPKETSETNVAKTRNRTGTHSIRPLVRRSQLHQRTFIFRKALYRSRSRIAVNSRRIKLTSGAGLGNNSPCGTLLATGFCTVALAFGSSAFRAPTMVKHLS